MSKIHFLACLMFLWNSRPLPAAENSVDPHATLSRFHFHDKEMDFAFGSLILGAGVNHGSETGEAFTTAALIKDGDASNWQKEWIKMGNLAEARGEKSLKDGHKISARDQFFRASYYYRAALVSMLPDNHSFKTAALKSRAMLKKAGALLDPPLEYIEIPFEGTVIPGYFRKAEHGDKPAKTLIMIGGAETFAEDQYFYIAPQAFERGYNFLTIDLPGQGNLPLEKRFFRRDMDVPIRAVVDYAIGRQDVDRARLAIYGISSGGGFAPQAAEKDSRIRALAMNNCVVNAAQGVAKMAVAGATEDVVSGWSSFKQGVNKSIAWRFGVDMDNLPGLVNANEGFSFNPGNISVPSMIIVANREYQNPEIQRQTKICFDGIRAAKLLVVTPAEEGASNHCVMENRSLMSQELFDWLDDVFKQ